MAQELIHSIQELAVKCYDADEGIDAKDAESEVSCGVFKYTECGCSFHHGDGCVTVRGYCEGSDVAHRSYKLKFPFTKDQWWQALEDADSDGKQTWDNTHGCEHCWTDGCCNDDGEELEFGGWPINPNCTKCEGEGVIL